MNSEAIRQLHLLLVQSLYDFMARNHPGDVIVIVSLSGLFSLKAAAVFIKNV